MCGREVLKRSYAHTFNLWLRVNVGLVRAVLSQCPLAQTDDEAWVRESQVWCREPLVRSEPFGEDFSGSGLHHEKISTQENLKGIWVWSTFTSWVTAETAGIVSRRAALLDQCAVVTAFSDHFLVTVQWELLMMELETQWIPPSCLSVAG